MDFYEVLDQIIDLLRQRGRVSYQALKRQFDVDDAYLEDLKVELIEVQELAADRDGKMLVWSGEAAQAPESTPVPATQKVVSPAITVHAGPPIAHTPPYLAEKILTSRHVLEGERKQVTVLFADIKDSTAWCWRAPPSPTTKPPRTSRLSISSDALSVWRRARMLVPFGRRGQDSACP